MTPKTSLPALVTTLLLASLAFTAGPVLAAGDATAVACPNEALVGFSPVLSECRGYEMVTPVFEAGEEPSVAAISADGSHVINDNLGTYAGRENGGFFTPYLVGRGEVGWGSMALSPSSTEFPAQQYLMASSDLSKTLWRFRSASEPITGEDLYLREANGSLIKIGPFVPPADQQGPPAGDDIHFFGQIDVGYQDASNDLSRVIFDIKKPGPLWPFDTTLPEASNHSSLYEYSEGRPAPALVGVSDGQTKLVGEEASEGGPKLITTVLAAGSLISDCQTNLGSEEEDAYNAMSANGTTVYFTSDGVESSTGSTQCQNEIASNPHSGAHAPVVNEVYARLGGSQTVPISEPSAGSGGQCVSCQVGEPARPAEFAGASEDGSMAFFITEQELFPSDTGKNLYEYNFDAPQGEHLIPVTGGDAKVLGVARVSEDGSHTYFVAEGDLTGSQKNAVGREAIPNQPNLYVFLQNAAHPTGELIFVTPLASSDRHAWASNDAPRRVQATPDGLYLAFLSNLNVASPGPPVEGSSQVFEYDAERGELVRVSIGQSGFSKGMEDADENGAELPVQSYKVSSQRLGPTRAGTNLAISADGSTVAFSSRGALTESALEQAGVPALSAEAETNGYIFHSNGLLSTGEVHLVAARIHLLQGLDASGKDVLFETPAQLVPFDTNGAVDIYDARIEGGVPMALTPAECTSENCLGAREAAPLLPGTGGSALANGVSPAPAVAPPAVVAPKAAPKALTTTQKLSRALRSCKKKSKTSRSACEKRARRTYGRQK
jgi:hypothetical protein